VIYLFEVQNKTYLSYYSSDGCFVCRIYLSISDLAGMYS